MWLNVRNGRHSSQKDFIMSESDYRLGYQPNEIRNFIDFMRMKMGVRNIEFQPLPSRGLYAQSTQNPDNCTVRTRCDFSITPVILVNHHWEIEELVFFRKMIEHHPQIVVVDVGANMGLFSRQVLGWSSNITHLFAYEPEPENFACLQHNLACFSNVTAVMAGLADSDGTVTLHMDVRNCGNNSLVSDQLAGAWHKSKMDVVIRDIKKESRRWLENGLPIFYKSDTQGYDELLLTLLPNDVCDAIMGGIVELERIDKPDFSIERFRAFLDRFPNKIVLRPGGNDIPVTTEQALVVLDTPSEGGVNLAFWR